MDIDENPFDYDNAYEYDEQVPNPPAFSNFYPQQQEEIVEPAQKRQAISLYPNQVQSFIEVRNVQNQVCSPRQKSNSIEALVTVSEYEDIIERIEQTKSHFQFIQSALKNQTDLESSIKQIETMCQKVSFKIKIQKFIEREQSTIKPELVTDIYLIDYNDLSINQEIQQGYLLLKYNKSSDKQLKENSNYILDKVQLILSDHQILACVTTKVSVLLEYQNDDFQEEICPPEEEEKMSQKVEKQKQNEIEPVFNSDLLSSHVSQLIYQENKVFKEELLDRIPVLSSTKQILQIAQNEVKQLAEKDKVQPEKIWTAKELLTWNIPETMSSSGCNLQRSRIQAEFLPPVISLYKFELVTQRILEQKVSFCGIVTHVKQDTWGWKAGKEQELNSDDDDQNELQAQRKRGKTKLLCSQVSMESIDDKSKYVLFLRHPGSVDVKTMLKKDYVLICRGERKISHNCDIYTQLVLTPKNLKILGKVTEEVNDFENNNRIQLLKTLPSQAIIRHMIKVCGFIIDINFIKVAYRCDVCRNEINNEQLCRNGCRIQNPYLDIQILCMVQDGTMKASLELKKQQALVAFRIGEVEQTNMKKYCMKYGTFMNPSSVQNYEYKDILSYFKRYDSWDQIIFYCKPYCKVTGTSDKRALANQQSAGNYNETISKPSFITQEKQKDKEIFLNGEVNLSAVNISANNQQKVQQVLVKPQICLKGIMVDHYLSREAVKNYYSLINNFN